MSDRPGKKVLSIPAFLVIIALCANRVYVGRGAGSDSKSR